MLVVLQLEGPVLVTLLGMALGIGLALLGIGLLQEGLDLSAYAEGLDAYGIGTRLRPVLRSGEIVTEGTGAELRERDDLFDTFVGGGSS